MSRPKNETSRTRKLLKVAALGATAAAALGSAGCSSSSASAGITCDPCGTTIDDGGHPDVMGVFVDTGAPIGTDSSTLESGPVGVAVNDSGIGDTENEGGPIGTGINDGGPVGTGINDGGGSGSG